MTWASAAYEGLPDNTTVTPWDEIETVYGKVLDAVSAAIAEPKSLAEALAYSTNLVRQSPSPSALTGTEKTNPTTHWQALRGVEQWSFYWVQNLGVFSQAQAPDLIKAAQNHTLRPGWCDFVERAQADGVHIHVISLNWSPSWIRLVLEQSSGCPDAVARISTYSPEILPPGVLPASDLNCPRDLFSGGDKTALIESILADVPAEEKRNVVFASDGMADLQPLWEGATNIGLAAGLNNSAAVTFRKHGVSVVNASSGWVGHTGEGNGGSGNSTSNFVYGFESWKEVEKLLWDGAYLRNKY